MVTQHFEVPGPAIVPGLLFCPERFPPGSGLRVRRIAAPSDKKAKSMMKRIVPATFDSDIPHKLRSR